MLAQRYNVRPSVLLGILDEHAAWCIDEASAIAGNLHEKKHADDQDSILTGVDGTKVDLRERDEGPKGIGSIKHVPGAGMVLNGSFPVVWRDKD